MARAGAGARGAGLRGGGGAVDPLARRRPVAEGRPRRRRGAARREPRAFRRRRRGTDPSPLNSPRCGPATAPPVARDRLRGDAAAVLRDLLRGGRRLRARQPGGRAGSAETATRARPARGGGRALRGAGRRRGEAAVLVRRGHHELSLGAHGGARGARAGAGHAPRHGDRRGVGIALSGLALAGSSAGTTPAPPSSSRRRGSSSGARATAGGWSARCGGRPTLRRARRAGGGAGGARGGARRVVGATERGEWIAGTAAMQEEVARCCSESACKARAAGRAKRAAKGPLVPMVGLRPNKRSKR